MPVNGQNNQKIPITTTGQGPGFPLQTSVAGQPGYPSQGPIQGATLPYWSADFGVPTFTAPIGSMYTDLRAATSIPVVNVFYVRIPTTAGGALIGVWHAVA